MLAVHSVEGQPLPTAEAMKRIYADVDAFNQKIKAQGRMLFAGGLMPGPQAKVVRIEQGRARITDGPFTESKEVIGGFAILEAKSKDDAIRMAREFLKVAGDGECELRQIYTASDPGCADPAATHSELVEQFAKR